MPGGLRRLGDALIERCARLGAAVHLGSEVDEVIVESGRVSGVRLVGGRAVPADVVVSDADATVLYGRLLRSGPRVRTAPARTALRRAPPRRCRASSCCWP